MHNINIYLFARLTTDLDWGRWRHFTCERVPRLDLVPSLGDDLPVDGHESVLDAVQHSGARHGRDAAREEGV